MCFRQIQQLLCSDNLKEKLLLKMGTLHAEVLPGTCLSVVVNGIKVFENCPFKTTPFVPVK